MHKDFFGRSQLAIENGFPLEAVFREYAAIEGRLEVILGLLGAPCSKFAKDEDRKKINISHRIACLEKAYASSAQLGNTKLDNSFFTELKGWCNERNTLVHGLYKNSLKYNKRSASTEKLAVRGEKYARMLYNEAKRLRRCRNSFPDIDLSAVGECCSEKCILFEKEKDNSTVC